MLHKYSLPLFLSSSIVLLSSFTNALPSQSSDITSHPLVRNTTDTANSTNAADYNCPPKTWYIGNFHTYQASSAPIIPYQAFYFTIYDGTGELASASCSRIGTPGQQVDDLLYHYDPNVWFPCHVYNRKATDIDHSPDSRSNYYFQWNDQTSTVYVKGRGICGPKETRSETLPPLKPNVPWVYSSLGTWDLGDESVNRKGFYRIYGDGGQVRLRHDGEGKPVKSFD